MVLKAGATSLFLMTSSQEIIENLMYLYGRISSSYMIHVYRHIHLYICMYARLSIPLMSLIWFNCLPMLVSSVLFGLTRKGSSKRVYSVVLFLYLKSACVSDLLVNQHRMLSIDSIPFFISLSYNKKVHILEVVRV